MAASDPMKAIELLAEALFHAKYNGHPKYDLPPKWWRLANEATGGMIYPCACSVCRSTREAQLIRLGGPHGTE